MTSINHGTVSLVICAYTQARWDDMVAAVNSVKTQTYLPSEIIMVIDHNPALLAKVQAALPDVIALENTEPRGLSGGRNCGIAAASGDLIAFLDDDAIAAPDWVEWLVRSIDEPEVIGAGALVKPLWSEPEPRWFPKEFYWVLGCSYIGLPPRRAEVRNLFGGCMCVRRELFPSIGGFRTGVGRTTGLPMGCEETELCIRALQKFPQRKFIYEPRARAYHRIIPGRANWKYFRERCYAEGLSKAKISTIVGANDALSSEWTYTLQTLPKGVLRGILSAIRGDVAGLGRAGAIVAGLAYTAFGYIAGRVTALRDKPVPVAPPLDVNFGRKGDVSP